jgi:hypothetical protein
MGAQAQGLLTAAQADKTASIAATTTATYQSLTADQQAELVGALQIRLLQQWQQPKRFWANYLN